MPAPALRRSPPHDTPAEPLRATPCDLCGAVRFELIATRDRRGRPLDTVICQKCGLISHRHVPTDAELDEFYGRRYRREYHGQAAPAPHRVVRAWRTGQRIYRLLKDEVRPGDRVFEVGAGIGCTVKAFELAGCDASGIEPGEDFQEFSQRELLAQVRRGRLADLSPEPAYDLLLLIHVIEHFNHPRRALGQLHQLLRPGGRLYVECPNVAAPHAAPGKLFHFAHVHNFTHDTLRMMAEACGFRLVRQMSRPGDVALAMLFAKADPARPAIDADSYRTALRGATRYNALTYHLRPRYLAERAARMGTLYADYLGARRRLAQILQTCRQHSHAPAAPAPAALRKSA